MTFMVKVLCSKPGELKRCRYGAEVKELEAKSKREKVEEKRKERLRKIER